MGKGKGHGRLAKALHRQQWKQQVRATKKLKLSNKEKAMAKKKSEYHGKPFVPFEKSSDDRVLLIGEGDFSFAVSVVEQGFVKPANLIATSFDSPDDLERKYPEIAEANLKKLGDKGVKTLHGIDATKLIKTLGLSENPKKAGKNKAALGGSKIDVVVFNFPHIGLGIKDQDRNIAKNQELVLEFFKNSQALFDLLKKNRGETGPEESCRVILSVFAGEPYDSWKPKFLAKKSINYKVQRSGRLDWDSYPGYHHRKTASMHDTTKKAADRDARMYVFESFNVPVQKKRKRHSEWSDSESESDED